MHPLAVGGRHFCDTLRMSQKRRFSHVTSVKLHISSTLYYLVTRWVSDRALQLRL